MVQKFSSNVVLMLSLLLDCLETTLKIAYYFFSFVGGGGGGRGRGRIVVQLFIVQNTFIITIYSHLFTTVFG